MVQADKTMRRSKDEALAFSIQKSIDLYYNIG
jgi:hypothetical protein